MNKSQKKSENGRSMVEMLGVLTVMGVLSVTGIAAYNNAMNRYRANELLHTLSLFAISASQSRLLGNPLFVEETAFSFPITVENNCLEYNNCFMAKISQLPSPICQQIKNQDWNVPFKIEINGKENGTCQSENEISFLFDDALEKVGKLNSKKEDGSCRGGYEGNLCDQHIDCPQNSNWGPDGCLCHPNWHGEECATYCEGFLDINDTCYECNHVYSTEASEKECALCSNRKIFESDNKDYCGLITCPSSRYQLLNGNCYLCSSGGAYFTTLEECLKCFQEGWSPRFMSADGRCYSCVNLANTQNGSTVLVKNTQECLGPCAGLRTFDPDTNLCIKIE